MKSDWELIQACQKQDKNAWQTIIKRYERLVLAIPLRYGLTRTDAEDVAQNTFVHLLEGLGQFHAGSNIKAWLITVAKRNSWRVMEKYDREQVNAAQDLGESALALGLVTIDEPKDGQAVERLYSGLQALDERCRLLLLALYFEQEKASYETLAQRFQLAKNSIGAIRARCLQRLRKNLELLLSEDRGQKTD